MPGVQGWLKKWVELAQRWRDGLCDLDGPHAYSGPVCSSVHLGADRQSTMEPRGEAGKGTGSGGLGTSRARVPSRFPTRSPGTKVERVKPQGNRNSRRNTLGSEPLPAPGRGPAGPAQLPTWGTSSPGPPRKHRTQLSPGRLYRFRAPRAPPLPWLTAHSSKVPAQRPVLAGGGAMYWGRARPGGRARNPHLGSHIESLGGSGPQPLSGPPSQEQGKEVVPHPTSPKVPDFSPSKKQSGGSQLRCWQQV